MIVAELGTVYASDIPSERVNIILDHASAAKHCGADAVKVQLFVPDEPLFCPMPGDEVRWERWRKTHIVLDEWRRIYETCRESYGIELFASAFQDTAVDWCNELGFKWHKVASRANKTYPYEKIPYDAAIVSGGNGFMTSLYCVSKYPTPLSEAMWPEVVDGSPDWNGLSDHSGTPWPSLDALARGAEIIEVHFALDREMAGPDKQVSLGPGQLKLICDFRDALKEMGRCSA